MQNIILWIGGRDCLGRIVLEITMRVLPDYFPFLPSPHLHVMQFQTNQSVIANFLFIPFFVIWNPIFISPARTRVKSPSQLQFFHQRLRASNSVLRCTSVSVSVCLHLFLSIIGSIYNTYYVTQPGSWIRPTVALLLNEKSSTHII